MHTGADAWIYKKKPFTGSGWRKRRKDIRKHKKQRAQQGWSVYDFWGADHYIAAVVAGLAARFRDHGVGYPGRYTAQDWAFILTAIEKPLVNYVMKSETGDDTPQDFAAADEAMHLFADHWMDFWD